MTHKCSSLDSILREHMQLLFDLSWFVLKGHLAGLVTKQSSGNFQASRSLGQELHESKTSTNGWRSKTDTSLWVGKGEPGSDRRSGLYIAGISQRRQSVPHGKLECKPRNKTRWHLTGETEWRLGKVYGLVNTQEHGVSSSIHTKITEVKLIPDPTGW